MLLDLTAAAPHASWAEAGSESAVATVFVDGQYNQDIFLFAGERAFAYRVLVGTFNLDSTRCESTSINQGPRCLFTSNRLSCDSQRRSKCSSGKVRIKN